MVLEAQALRPALRVTQFDAVESKFGPGFKSVLPSSAARITDHRRRGVVPIGEPDPGRSALDMRRATA